MSGDTEVRHGARAPTREDVVTLVDFSIRRALAFGGLAIATTMTALCYDPVLSFRVGGVMAAAILFGLLFKAFEATRCKIRRTEIWMLLDSAGQRPAPGIYPLIAAVLPDCDIDTTTVRNGLIKEAQEAIAEEWHKYDDVIAEEEEKVAAARAR